MSHPLNHAELEAHLRHMIELEKRSGDFLLASVIQDSLVYNLHGYVNHQELNQISRFASEIAVKAAVEALHRDPSTILQTCRGVMHALANLGLDPVVAAISVTFGTLHYLADTADELDVNAIVKGVSRAADELGVGTETVRACEHLVWCLRSPAPSTAPIRPAVG
ncbi:hypothetical protein [Alicyclobacillus sp. ALC3]|uniref:hypothetical protein n=1 Tax=Alicyclobacillus sp. ALC3 TaxID=2796143 RepID=UPI0023785849|nr:hypothetical protein [Alicyclobacillus sp. ALC3]WDL97489.1 hypothetical protein JC200_01800 [Alicyclobacillus sp. ALC3]